MARYEFRLYVTDDTGRSRRAAENCAAHEKQILEFTIDGQGLHVGEPFTGLSGILGLARSTGEHGGEPQN